MRMHCGGKVLFEVRTTTSPCGCVRHEREREGEGKGEKERTLGNDVLPRCRTMCLRLSLFLLYFFPFFSVTSDNLRPLDCLLEHRRRAIRSRKFETAMKISVQHIRAVRRARSPYTLLRFHPARRQPLPRERCSSVAVSDPRDTVVTPRERKRNRVFPRHLTGTKFDEPAVQVERRRCVFVASRNLVKSLVGLSFVW